MSRHPATELVRPASGIPEGYAALSQGVFHASTIVFPDVAAFLNRGVQHDYSYGQSGTPTTHALASKVAQLEGGGDTVLVPSGLAAIVLVNSVVLKAGDHALLPRHVYGPNLAVMQRLFAKWGVAFSIYDEQAGADLASMLRPNTRLVWTESPGSTTLVMQDVAALTRIAHAHGALVAMDNTWATPLGYRPLDADVDFSVQALTKYAGGHSDLLMGAVTTRAPRLAEELRATSDLLGYYVAPDECFLVLRGLPTMALRLERHFASALRVAGWLATHPAVAQVHYPPLPGDPGHALWRRDYQLGSGLLSLRLRADGLAPIEKMVERLRLFTLGNSWGAVHSLVAVAPVGPEQWLIRLHVGIEQVDDLIADLRQALAE